MSGLRIRSGLFVLVFTGLLSAISAEESDVADENDDIPNIIVTEKYKAYAYLAGIVEAPISLLRYNPQVELQSRGLAETQTDISVRGGIFENTGVMIGAVTLFDPQTGHYMAELPLDPASLGEPTLLTGVDNAVTGFNSAVASIQFDLNEIGDDAYLGLGVGTDGFHSSQFRYARKISLQNNAHLASQISYASSQGDGSRENGDHDLTRGSVHTQYVRDSSQTDLILSYQDKFYGWPGAYTGFSSLAETDLSQTSLLLLNHRYQQTEQNWFELGTYYRELDDDYDFDRATQESGAPGSFEHKTKSYAVGLQGERSLTNLWSVRYGSQLTGDKLVRSTDLLGGDFNSRRYATLSLVPTRTWKNANNSEWRLRAGSSFDYSNEDENVLLPLLGLSHTKFGSKKKRVLSIDYSASSQLPGYTALKSGTSGLFGGNPDLGRERADTLELSAKTFTDKSQSSLSVFYRKDDDLVDWTFSSASPFARQANAVDLDVSGLEWLWQRHFSRFDITAGYLYLNKNADYADTFIDASYYALNYAKHRLVASSTWTISDSMSFQLDTELRQQEENVLRGESDDAFEVSVAYIWEPLRMENLRFDLIINNITNSNFQEFQGTPAARRSAGLKASYRW